MAAILAAAAHVEHMLAQELEARGIISWDDSPSFDALVRYASALGLFPPDMVKRIDALWLARNPLTSAKPVVGPQGREDAQVALAVMHEVFVATTSSLKLSDPGRGPA